MANDLINSTWNVLSEVNRNNLTAHLGYNEQSWDSFVSPNITLGRMINQYPFWNQLPQNQRDILGRMGYNSNTWNQGQHYLRYMHTPTPVAIPNAPSPQVPFPINSGGIRFVNPWTLDGHEVFFEWLEERVFTIGPNVPFGNIDTWWRQQHNVVPGAGNPPTEAQKRCFELQVNREKRRLQAMKNLIVIIFSAVHVEQGQGGAVKRLFSIDVTNYGDGYIKLRDYNNNPIAVRAAHPAAAESHWHLMKITHGFFHPNLNPPPLYFPQNMIDDIKLQLTARCYDEQTLSQQRVQVCLSNSTPTQPGGTMPFYKNNQNNKNYQLSGCHYHPDIRNAWSHEPFAIGAGQGKRMTPSNDPRVRLENRDVEFPADGRSATFYRSPPPGGANANKIPRRENEPKNLTQNPAADTRMFDGDGKYDALKGVLPIPGGTPAPAIRHVDPDYQGKGLDGHGWELSPSDPNSPYQVPRRTTVSLSSILGQKKYYNTNNGNWRDIPVIPDTPNCEVGLIDGIFTNNALAIAGRNYTRGCGVRGTKLKEYTTPEPQDQGDQFDNIPLTIREVDFSNHAERDNDDRPWNNVVQGRTQYGRFVCILYNILAATYNTCAPHCLKSDCRGVPRGDGNEAQLDWQKRDRGHNKASHIAAADWLTAHYEGADNDTLQQAARGVAMPPNVDVLPSDRDAADDGRHPPAGMQYAHIVGGSKRKTSKKKKSKRINKRKSKRRTKRK